MPITPDQCAAEVLEIVPLLMRSIIHEMRKHRGSNLSAGEFRVLNFLRRENMVSLSRVADHLGVTLPSTSKLVDGLVAKKLVQRRTSANDRRHVELTLTPSGKSLLEVVRAKAKASLGPTLGALSCSEREEIIHGMQKLQGILESKKGGCHGSH